MGQDIHKIMITFHNKIKIILYIVNKLFLWLMMSVKHVSLNTHKKTDTFTASRTRFARLFRTLPDPLRAKMISLNITINSILALSCIMRNNQDTILAGLSYQIRSLLVMARILVVEDQSDIRSLLTLRLELEEHEIETAENGAIGVEKALANSYDAILMDMHMPVMDGHEAVRMLRDKGYTGLIVAVTASASLHDTHRSIKEGCNAFISKPIDDDFEARIGEILIKHGQSIQTKPS